jgi:hypothetical protein
MAKFNLGDRVSWSVRGCDGTIIGVPVDLQSMIVLVGWVKDGPPHFHWDIKQHSHLLQSDPCDLIQNIRQYKWAYWVGLNELVLVDRADAPVAIKVQAPVQCKRCKNRDFPFAEANQADGSFMCWSCQHYPFYK